MPRIAAFALSAAVALAALPAHAGDAGDFMLRFSGAWVGTGQVLFGAEPRPEFACDIKGDPSDSKLTFDMTGQCHMGAFSAPIYGQVRYDTGTRSYYGQFLGGANGAGADIVGAQAGESISLKLMRGSMQGRLAAETTNADEMKVLIYYRDPATKTETPVIAMGFTRKDVITGSIAPAH
jgi:hypothetical protein